MRFWTKYMSEEKRLAWKRLRKTHSWGWFRAAMEKSHVVKGLIAVSGCAGAVGILAIGHVPSRETMSLYVGQPAPWDVIVDIGFYYENVEETEKLRAEAEQKVRPRYAVSSEKLLQSARQISEFLTGAAAEVGKTATPVAGVESGAGERVEILTPKELESLRVASDHSHLAKRMETFIRSVEKSREAFAREAEQQMLKEGGGQDTESHRLAILKILDDEIAKWSAATFPRDRRVREAAASVLKAVCDRSVDYDEVLTRSMKQRESARIRPVITYVKPGSKIVERGYEVTPKQMRVYSAYLERREQVEPLAMKMRQRLYNALGLTLLIVVLIILSRRYLSNYQKRTYESNSSLFMLEIILLGSLLMSRGISAIPFSAIRSAWNNIFYYFVVISVPMAAILMTILFNRTLALFFVVLAGILVGTMKGFSLAYTMVSVVGGIIAVYSAIAVRRRAQIVRAGATIALANVITIGAIDALANLNIVSATVGYRVLGGAISGMVSAFVAASFLPLFEHAFDVVTEFRLLELSDLNHPLLKRMFIEAPGTYHHSIMVGNLAEAAAEAVGANPLQVRVCSYFHDIGKMNKPEYFSENEAYGKSMHDRLNPRMSNLIILSHVKDGIDMAVEHKLNRKIIDAIREHHGNGLVYFFYWRAEEMKGEGEEIPQEDFRYPGPKPQSKETAIILLSDAVEAASRSLSRPTPSRIRNLVRRVINDRIIDGQLDECDLTFNDLRLIVEIFEHVLNSTFHARVKYPGIGDEEDNKIEGSRAEPPQKDQG